jgi:hypothetical protein
MALPRLLAVISNLGRPLTVMYQPVRPHQSMAARPIWPLRPKVYTTVRQTTTAIIIYYCLPQVPRLPRHLPQNGLLDLLIHVEAVQWPVEAIQTKDMLGVQ